MLLHATTIPRQMEAGTKCHIFQCQGLLSGSIGDIIAVAQIASALALALNDSRGSAKEYQSLKKELQAFDQALLQVV